MISSGHQKPTNSNSDWRVVQAGLRFLTVGAESRYAAIELECLAVGWAMKKCHLFLAGLGHFTIVTNHNPLIPIPNSHRLDEFETKIIELSHLEPYVC